MKTTEKKIEEAFAEFGIRMLEADAEFHIEKSKLIFDKRPSSEQFVKDICERLCSGHESLKLLNFNKFHLKMGLGDKWKGLPNWFAKTLSFDYYARRGTFGTDSTNKWLSKRWMKSIPNGEFKYFEDKMENKEEYQLKKLFSLDENEVMEIRRKMLERAYAQLDQIIYANENIHQLSARIEKLLIEEYENIYIKKAKKKQDVVKNKTYFLIEDVQKLKKFKKG